jgi:putative ABC transport system permease protein
MSEAIDLSFFSMVMCTVLLLIPLGVTTYFKLGISKSLLISSVRMIIQLVLIGFFLEYLFKYNNVFLNITWFVVMLLAAVISVLNNSGLQLKFFVKPVFGALFLSNFLIVLYFNYFIARLDFIFDARYLIAIGGMILGNTLRSNIIGLGDFYKSVQRDEQLYYYKLSLGASTAEALIPFAKRSFKAALSPSIATMATMGIVSLPGMMTGQILGGSVPLVAIKYQIAIMAAILTSTVLSIGLSILFSVPSALAPNGTLRKEMFK